MDFKDGFFNVNGTNGFLPMKQPLQILPYIFNDIQQLVDNLPKIILVKDEIVEKVKNLNNYVDMIDASMDKFLLCALLRAYTFITSAYLLESSYVEFKNTGEYGVARRFIPKNIAQPLCKLSDIIGVYPWLEYSYSYSLGNWYKKDQNKGMELENLKLAVSFSGTEDEEGFILVHVAINQHSKDLIKWGEVLTNSLELGCLVNLNESLIKLKETLQKMNDERRKMWKASNPSNYNNFRIFIMGIMGNEKMFGDGVIYEGVSDKPMKYRGQSGSQDSIIPYLDTLLRIIDEYPKNELTDYLMEMRSYRPKVFQNYIEYVNIKSKNLINRVDDIDEFRSLNMLYDVIDEIWKFRNGHWQFVQRYIMMNTKYNVATGGTPINTWIPNQIEATLKTMKNVLLLMNKYIYPKDVNDSCLLNLEIYSKKELDWNNKVKMLVEQIEELKKANYDAKLCYYTNFRHSLSDYQQQDV
jgi:indoleamine 2,3-dioxygenase